MMSIFVPKTFGYSAERIKSLVERDLGKVRQVDIVKETCFIHLEEWYEGDRYPTFQAIDRMEKGEAHKITSFDHATNSYTTLFLLKNHSKKQSREVHKKELKKEKDVLEQIEEGGEQEGGYLKPLSLVHPDSLAQPQVRWRPPSPPGPPPPLPPGPLPPRMRSHQQERSRQNRTEGRSAADDQYIYRLEKEISSLRAQNHAYVKEINELRIYNYTQQAAADTRWGDAYNTPPSPGDEREEQVEQSKLDANNEYNAKAVPKPRRRAGAAPRASSSRVSGDVRVETF